ncbi:hypothetical protein [Roseococcus pinisoli]|uniref:Uncharacterized protein n=1 Tax=Roseococcus pinisoli TaxID=2835040 RepID=A0ABS5QDZ4_9PROT|nr:hypothetical protein [Roseococcus pinisoli]MBS7811779.1 hypothetical protein [Roseococcus pinisoli]
MNSIDITLLAAERLEAALDRLAEALEARFAAEEEAALKRMEQDAVRLLVDQEAARLLAGMPDGQLADAAGSADMVPRAEVDRLAARLDEALARLRGLLGEDASGDT